MESRKPKHPTREGAEHAASSDDATGRHSKEGGSSDDGGTLLDLSAGGATTDLPGLDLNVPTRVLAREESGPRIGHYRILKEHARGGMGRVLLAVDTSIGRKVALKELLSGVGTDGAGESAGTRSIGERFLREARVTGRLEHPNIVPVYEIGEGPNGFYYSMRFVGGRTLAQELTEINQREHQRDRLAGRLQLLDAFCDVCNAVAYAHSKGVIHRDLKPSNIMLGEFGETVVLDWGLARVRGEDNKVPAGSIVGSEADSSQLTLDGAVIGTPAYMPPEQARGELDDVDELSDVYALGAVLYEILSGAAPYVGGSPRSIVQRVIAEPPQPVGETEPGAPAELVVLCARAMERNRAARLPSALELAQEVKAFRDGKTLQSYDYSSIELLKRFLRRHWKLVGVIALAVTAVAVIAAVAFNEVVNERNAAETALDKATTEEARRIAAEEASAAKARELLASREAAIRRAEDAIAGYDADMLLRDLYARVESYDNAGMDYRVGIDERARNRALITSVLGYASQLQELVRLRTVDGARQDERVSRQVERLRGIQTALVELAIHNTDFELARYLMSSSELPEARIADLNERTQARETRMLDWRAARIVACLDDARMGLRRDGRAAGAPGLSAYVEELSGFQDDQTIRMVANELEQLTLRLRGLERPIGVVDIDMAGLLCSVLGRLQKPSAAVPLLVKFLRVQTHPRLIDAAAKALSATQHPLGTRALVDEALRRDFMFVEDYREAFADAYAPPTEDALVRGLLLFARSKYAEAAAVLAAQAGGGATTYRALALLASGGGDEARRLLDELLKTSPGSPALHVARARVDADAREISHYDTAVELAPDTPRVLLERGQFCRGRYAVRAIDDALELTRRWPGIVQHWQLLGDAYRDRGLYRDALPAYERAVKVDPDSAEAWLFLGATYRALDRIDPAYEALEEAVRLDPHRSHAVAKLGEIEFFRRDYPRCIELTNRAVAISPTEQDAWYYQGLAYLRMIDGGEKSFDVINARARNPVERANMEKAVGAFAGLVRNAPTNYRGWALMATTLAALGRDDEAREAIASADELAFFGANTVGMGTQLLREAEIWMEARQAAVPDPITAEQFLDSALVSANESYHSSELVDQRRFLRAALVALQGAVHAVGDSPSRAQTIAERRVRRAIVAAMRRGKFFHAIDAIILPVIEGGPDWSVLPDRFYRCEALIGLGLQYRDDTAMFLGASDEECAARHAELDSMTGVERKLIADELIARGFEIMLAVAEDGYDQADGGGTQVTRRLLNDSRRLRARDLFLRNRTEARDVRAHPYAVLVVSTVVRNMQADRLGLKQFDVIHSIGGQRIRAAVEVGAAMAKATQEGRYEMIVHRYLLDENGRPVQAKDEAGNPKTDERGNPVMAFQEITLHPEAGLLGISIETGYQPHPLDS